MVAPSIMGLKEAKATPRMTKDDISIAQWALDDLTQGAPIHYLKLDVEGQEANALLGAQQTIQQYKPRMLVSAYHRSEDLFRLPLLIHQMRPDYRIYLRHHPYIPEWDTNFYFI